MAAGDTRAFFARVLEVCKRRGVAAIDLNGRTWIKADGVLVDRAPRSEQSFRYELGAA